MPPTEFVWNIIQNKLVFSGVCYGFSKCISFLWENLCLLEIKVNSIGNFKYYLEGVGDVGFCPTKGERVKLNPNGGKIFMRTLNIYIDMSWRIYGR